jgi:hypothetical protein
MIVCDRLVRIYSGEGIEVQALQGLDLLIAEGELTALIAATDERGTTTLHAREYATLDRAGRVQLPREMTRRLGMRNPGRIAGGARPHRRLAGPGRRSGTGVTAAHYTGLFGSDGRADRVLVTARVGT